MSSQVQRSTTSLNVLDRYFQHRIHCFEEEQGQLQALVAELQSEVQMRSKQTDDAVAELRDKLAKVLCNSYEKSAIPLGSQQRSGALAQISPAASPFATPPRSRPFSAGHNMRPGQSGGDASLQIASAEATHISAPAVTTLASPLSRGMLPTDVAEMVVHPPEIAAKVRVAPPWHGGALSGSQSNLRSAHNLQQRHQQPLQHMQAMGVTRQSSIRGTFQA